MLTAAHCINTPDKRTERVFIPAYNKWVDAPEPYGRWAVTGYYLLPSWRDKKDGGTFQDVAILRVCQAEARKPKNPRERDTGSGQDRVPGTCDPKADKIQDTTGYFTVLLDPKGRYRFVNLGYPGDELAEQHVQLRLWQKGAEHMSEVPWETSKR